MDASLQALLRAELSRPAPPEVRQLAEALAGRGGAATAAVLYYGSALRAGEQTGILDFYVLMDDVAAWPAGALAHLANRALPPNVGYLEHRLAGGSLRAKFAIISPTQFAARLTERSLDTTLWARFCQPALCVWARGAADRDAVTALISAAVVRAGLWAARLGPGEALAEDYWRALFARTYAAELRVEKSGRPQDIVGQEPQRYATLLPLAWEAGGLAFDRRDDGRLAARLGEAERAQAARQWARRARHGRRLNLVRLLKAAFTFEGAMDYVAWKVERHRGIKLQVRPWQRRFPLLAAPFLYWKLRRLGVLSRGERS